MTTTQQKAKRKAKRSKKSKPLGTIWEVSDALWMRILPILKKSWPRKKTGRPVADWRRILNGIIFRMRSGCQWERLPRKYGPKSTVHDWFQRWCHGGVMRLIWKELVSECDELGGVDWEWQSADGWLGKARFGGEKVGKNPTDRGKNGTKKSVLVEGDGGPLGMVIAGANKPDAQLLRATIEAIVVPRPTPTKEHPQHLCLDKGYDNPTARNALKWKRYTPHIPRIREASKPVDRSKGHKPHRWVVERTLAWLSKCRALLIRYDKKHENYLGLLQLGCALLWYRRLHRLGHGETKVEPRDTS